MGKRGAPPCSAMAGAAPAEAAPTADHRSRGSAGAEPGLAAPRDRVCLAGESGVFSAAEDRASVGAWLRSAGESARSARDWTDVRPPVAPRAASEASSVVQVQKSFRMARRR